MVCNIMEAIMQSSIQVGHVHVTQVAAARINPVSEGYP